MASSDYEYDREWKNILPIGFQFVPKDEELFMYLRLKSCNGNIPPGIFTDLDIYYYTPQELFAIGNVEKHWGGRMYIFTPLIKKYSIGGKMQRTIHSGKGFWKASQARKAISKNRNLDKQMCESSFTKQSLVYYEGSKSASGKKTSWLMSEYRFPVHDPRPLFNGTDHELTLCVIYYNYTKKNAEQGAVLTESDPITAPPQTPINQNFDQPSYTLHIPHNPNPNYDHNTSHQENPSYYPNFFPSGIPLQQYQHLINRAAATIFDRWPVEYPSSQNYTDVATTSTMQPSFVENLDISSSIAQNYDFHGIDPSIYHNFENSYYAGEEEIGHIANSNADIVDQNKLETYAAPISQDDQKPLSDGQDHNHQQLKMKKIRV
ncbi:uncharacterized protein LOC132638033 [Lycium barbarum]|uniref:uncharacterized protein LOC132638033 n=1 Tax=Lycium barbarum TaxID=112863 RepID=UPI00293E7236|nr:uncharacterized protein LOC132638033 [Lycium barbarum]